MPSPLPCTMTTEVEPKPPCLRTCTRTPRYWVASKLMAEAELPALVSSARAEPKERKISLGVPEGDWSAKMSKSAGNERKMKLHLSLVLLALAWGVKEATRITSVPPYLSALACFSSIFGSLTEYLRTLVERKMPKQPVPTISCGSSISSTHALCSDPLPRRMKEENAATPESFVKRRTGLMFSTVDASTALRSSLSPLSHAMRAVTMPSASSMECTTPEYDLHNQRGRDGRRGHNEM